MLRADSVLKESRRTHTRVINLTISNKINLFNNMILIEGNNRKRIIKKHLEMINKK
jgi:hypothetical protein